MRLIRVTVLMCLIAAVGFCQHRHTVIKMPDGKQMLPGGIDGAVTPELIPDTIAYRMFFQLMAESAQATPHERDRQRANLAPARLSDADLEQVFTILADFRIKLMDLMQQFYAARTAALESHLTFDGNPFSQQRDALTQSTLASLEARLTAPGMKRLKAYVQSEKKNMTVFPMPDMPGGSN